LTDRGVSVDIQVASTATSVPEESEIRSWIADVVRELEVDCECEVSIRIVDEEEGRALNKRFRDINQATNVLSFPSGQELLADQTPDLPHLLGDIVICGPIVEREAHAQHKSAAAHWAHLLVHGTLHLLGHDHEADAQAAEMESIETRILARRGVSDPYIA
jgi:probable rRNA maturation factor